MHESTIQNLWLVLARWELVLEPEPSQTRKIVIDFLPCVQYWTNTEWLSDWDKCYCIKGESWSIFLKYHRSKSRSHISFLQIFVSSNVQLSNSCEHVFAHRRAFVQKGMRREARRWSLARFKTCDTSQTGELKFIKFDVSLSSHTNPRVTLIWAQPSSLLRWLSTQVRSEFNLCVWPTCTSSFTIMVL